jgi:preprotein translocase subunit SecG
VTPVILAFQIASAVALILFILLHAGRGGGLSEMFGGGMSGSGGSTVVEKNLDRITVVTAIIFTVSTVVLHFRIR